MSGGPLAPGPLQLQGGGLEEGAPVGDAGEGVGAGQVLLRLEPPLERGQREHQREGGAEQHDAFQARTGVPGATASTCER